ncbi:MAG: LacI family transcriptional regulator [Firmicutes bacterium HGW-Firmicutes-3]|jgi:LacI family transcriptional regulator|nr:MAG: LacI family transcriptional regulator [Firmicutes bacterium HGW-Firmicutes-3]
MVTIKDIAKRAGISITTVSRALNNYDDVNEATRERIFNIAKEIGYIPNRAAQSLVMKKSNRLGIILTELERNGGKDNIVYRLLSGMYSYAETVNYEVALYTSSSAHQREKSFVQFCNEHNIGGAVVAGIRTDDPYVKELLNSELPCVLIDLEKEGRNISSVSIDNKQAAKEATIYLIDHNHKHIGMINGRKAAAVSIERYKGYKEALDDKGIVLPENYVVYADFMEDMAYDMAKELLGRHPEITALFCASDLMALSAMKAIKDMNLSIPEDISIIGFDNIPLSEYSTPALTTVNQDFYLMGEAAAIQLLKMMQNEVAKKHIYLEHKILARDSVRMI